MSFEKKFKKKFGVEHAAQSVAGRVLHGQRARVAGRDHLRDVLHGFVQVQRVRLLEVARHDLALGLGLRERCLASSGLRSGTAGGFLRARSFLGNCHFQ